ncbi:Hexuronate transporter [compost metagenome]
MTRQYRWQICALLFFATTINYLDRQVLGLLKPLLEQEFHWSESDYSYLVIVFQASYALGLLVFGRLIDRFGSRIGYAFCLLVWSIAAMGHALAQGMLSFAFMRGLLGLGESGNFPAAIKAVSEWFPQRERALAVGILTSGTSVGAILAPACVPWLAATYGWQWAFIITGLSGLVWLAFWLPMYKLPQHHPRVSVEELRFIQQDPVEAEQSSTEVRWTSLLRMKKTWTFIVGKFITDPIWWFMLFWLPSYFSDRFQLDLKHLGLPLMIVYLATSAGSISGGWISSKLIARGWQARQARQSTMLAMALLVLPIAFSAYIDSMWLMVGLLSLAAAAHQGWSANLFTTVTDNFPRTSVGSVMGIGGMAGSLGGMLFPLAVGMILDHYKALDLLSAGYNLLFVGCGCAYLAAWLLMRAMNTGIDNSDDPQPSFG